MSRPTLVVVFLKRRRKKKLLQSVEKITTGGDQIESSCFSSSHVDAESTPGATPLEGLVCSGERHGNKPCELLYGNNLDFSYCEVYVVSWLLYSRREGCLAPMRDFCLFATIDNYMLSYKSIPNESCFVKTPLFHFLDIKSLPIATDLLFGSHFLS